MPCRYLYARVDARGLELLIVLERGIELLLRAVEVALLLLQTLLPVLFRARLTLNIGLLLSLRHIGVAHEPVVLLLSLGFPCRGLGLEPGEVGLDHLDHPHDAAA